jgi:hypothetical protein
MTSIALKTGRAAQRIFGIPLALVTVTLDNFAAPVLASWTIVHHVVEVNSPSLKEGIVMNQGAGGYVPCRVEPGMFRGEYLVFLDVADPDNPERMVKAQALVDERELKEIRGTPKRNSPVPAWLRVEVVGPERGFIRVALPQPAQPGGESVLVNENEVRQEVTA